MGNSKNKKSSKKAVEVTSSPETKPTIAMLKLQAAEAAFDKIGMDFGVLVAQSNLEKLMAESNSPVASHDRKKQIYPSLRTTDVVFGRGSKVASHPGNVLFRHILIANQEFYLQLEDREDQRRAIDVMMAHFEERIATRYVEVLSEGKYQSVTYDRIFEKFVNLFRETREKWCSAIVTHAKVIDAASPGKSNSMSATPIKSPSKAERRTSSRIRNSKVDEDESKASAVKSKTSKSGSDDSDEESFDAGMSVEQTSQLKKKDSRFSAAKSRTSMGSPGSEGAAEGEAEEKEHGAHFSKASRRERARLDRNKNLEVQPVVTPELESVRKLLEGDGISVERFLFEARIERLRKKYRPSKMSTEKWDPAHPIICRDPAPCDVLLGRGQTVQSHAGNVLMRHVMGINHDYYQSLKRPEKDPAADALIAYFEFKGIRFLEEGKGWFQKVSYARVAEKFKSCMRTGIAAFQGAGSVTVSLANAPVEEEQTATAAAVPAPRRQAKAPKRFSNFTTLAPAPSPVPVSPNPNPVFLEEMYVAEKALQQKGTSLVDFLAGSKLEHLTDKSVFRFSELSKGERVVLKEYDDAGPLDIIFGRGNTWNRHAGNWLFRQIVGMNQEFYRDGICRSDKSFAADALVGHFETLGARFLEVTEDSRFIEVEYSRVVEKFKQGLRERILQKTLLSLSDAACISSSKSAATSKAVVTNRTVYEMQMHNKKQDIADMSSRMRNKKRDYADVDSYSDDSDDDSRFEKVAKVTPEVLKKSQFEMKALNSSKKMSKSSDYIVKKNPEDYLRVSHFVMGCVDKRYRGLADKIQDDEDDEVDEEELGRSLHNIRYAIRTSIPMSSRPHGSGRSHADKEVEKLMQIYRPSQSRKFGTGTKSPCPVFI